MSNKNLMTVKAFADQYPSERNGTGVSPAYIYKLLKTKSGLPFKLVVIAGVHFIEVLEQKKVEK